MRFTLEFPTFNVRKILRLSENESLNLSPGFQRESVWEVKNRALLIDSILQCVPLPSILLWHQKKGNKNIYHVVDGKQRIETLIEFTKHQLPFTFEKSIVLKHHRNKDWSVIYNQIESDSISYKLLEKQSKSLKKQFDNFQIPVVVIKDTDSIEDIRELFVRVNSTGMKLAPSEIRHARFLKSNLLIEAERIANLPKVKDFFLDNKIFSPAHFKRMKVIEFITELMLSFKSNDILDKKASIDAMMENQITNVKVKRLGIEVISMLDFISKYISKKDFRLRTTRFKNTADLYALIFCLWKMQKTSGYILKDAVRADFAFSILVDLDKQLKKYSVAHKEGKSFKSLPSVAMRYQKTVLFGTDSGANRSDRVTILTELLKSIFVKKDVERIFSKDLKELLWHSTDRMCTIQSCLCKTRRIEKYEDLEIDHRFAHSKGGKTHSANAQIAHARCNRAKGAGGKL